MNPWKVVDSGAARLHQQTMNGGPLVLLPQAAMLKALLAAASPATRELRWVRTAGHTLVRAQIGWRRLEQKLRAFGAGSSRASGTASAVR